jgi:hypothetical protein
MIYQARNLSPHQKAAVEGLLGRPVAEGESISIRAISNVPKWLQQSWESAKQTGVDQLSAEEIDEEIVTARQLLDAAV